MTCTISPTSSYRASPTLPTRRSGDRRGELTVRCAGGLNALVAPGGGERQLQATTAALQQLGVTAAPWRPWEESLSSIDVLHLFGTLREHIPLLLAARKAGIRTVVSPIAWYDSQSIWHEPRRWPRRLLGCARHGLRRVAPQLPNWRRTIYHLADALLPNSQSEAEQLIRLFDVEPEKVHVIPNGADPQLATANPVLFRQFIGRNEFVLCAGRIEPRKNQLGLVQAMRYAEFPHVVFLGDPVPGHERYMKRCRELAGDRATFVPRIAAESPLLRSAYAACRCLVMPSFFETPGLVAIEAGMSGVPLVVTARGATREYFGGEALYVAPQKHRELAHAVQFAATLPRNRALATLCRTSYSWAAAAECTRDVYASLF